MIRWKPHAKSFLTAVTNSDSVAATVRNDAGSSLAQLNTGSNAIMDLSALADVSPTEVVSEFSKRWKASLLTCCATGGQNAPADPTDGSAAV